MPAQRYQRDGVEHEVEAVDLAGRWQNDLGSIVIFEQDGTRLTGRYHTAVGEPDKDAGFPVVGFCFGERVSFSVHFEGFGTITAWVGQVVPGAPLRLKTLWQLVRQTPGSGPAWDGVVAGASTFERQS